MTSELFDSCGADLVRKCFELFSQLDEMSVESKIEVINEIRSALHQHSPLKDEPVDFVRWVKGDSVTANDYNPNSVAPPEMELLRKSIRADGYTQPIVSWGRDSVYEVVDGFHRHRVGRECKEVNERVLGYLPLVVINQNRKNRSDRIAATIRHNRARGKHKVEAMSDIVIELKRRNWSDEKIGRELGMDADEVLRLTQITGLAEMFENQEFSEAWKVGRDGGVGGEILSDIGEEPSDKGGRVLHTWEKWECFKAGFYDERPPEGMKQDEGEEKYRAFLSDLIAFESALEHITKEWTFSCEHYLTNERMNRIAWLGQASVAHALRIPSCCRGGYNRLSDGEKYAADQMALKHLNRWLQTSGRNPLMLADAGSKTEADLY